MQHSIAKQGESLWKLLSQDGAYIYVCGCVRVLCFVTSITERFCVHVDVTRDRLECDAHRGTKMGADVKAAFKEVCKQYGGGRLFCTFASTYASNVTSRARERGSLHGRCGSSTSCNMYACFYVFNCVTGLSEDKAKSFIADLEGKNRYVQELWSV